MKIVPMSAQIIRMTPDPDQAIEQAARECYQSQPRGEVGDLIRNVLYPRGHHAMLEFADLHMRFVADRGVMIEARTHRAGTSFAVESTRWVRHKDGIEVISPFDENETSVMGCTNWYASVRLAEDAYGAMLAAGHSPQTARSVLPNCLKCSFHMKANFRQWLHVFRLRLSSQAHPQMVQLMRLAWSEIEGTSVVWECFKQENPKLFEGWC